LKEPVYYLPHNLDVIYFLLMGNARFTNMRISLGALYPIFYFSFNILYLFMPKITLSTQALVFGSRQKFAKLNPIFYESLNEVT
jgi:hypothetical protein